jgi:hypothetical protein
MTADVLKLKPPAERLRPPDSRALAIERCADQIERALDERLTIHQRIGLERALEAFGADWQRATRGDCGFEGCPYAD